MTTLAWLILWIPFAASVTNALFFLRKPRIAGWVSTATMAFCFLLSCVLLAKSSAFMHEPLESSVLWIPAGVAPIEFGVLLNGLTLLMALIVTGIGSLIFLYSISYMEHEEGVARYFSYLSLFAFSMLGIVFANNLIQIFVFWEMVGVSSYLLIGFWFGKESASTAGKKAFLTTRVGDVGMMIGILMLVGYLAQAGVASFNFMELKTLFAAAGHAHEGTPGLTIHGLIPPAAMTAIALLIFMGVMGKSAQVPLHVWLPDAMEGPTPVSALIHAATMVAAGVFLLVRINFIFISSETAMLTIAWVGGVTALIAGTVAVVQDDIKKILAYSTLSQLGYMVMALGLGSAEAGMFHLTTHAFFKALLFLGAGSLIHAFHTQDIWEMRKAAGGGASGTISAMPVTSWTFLIATFALMGIPPLSGYFSKEEVLAAAQHGPAPLFWLALAVVFMTAFYMGRLCAVVFFPKKAPGGSAHGHEIRESGWKMTAPLVILGVFSVIGGFLPVKNFVGIHQEAHHEGAWMLAAGSVLLGVLGFTAAYFLHRAKSRPGSFPGQELLARKFYFDEFYDALIKHVQENIAAASDFFERVVVVKSAVNGTASGTRQLGNFLRRLQTGVVQFYALVFTLSITAIAYVMILMRN